MITRWTTALIISRLRARGSASRLATRLVLAVRDAIASTISADRVQPRVQQMPRRDIGQRLQHRILHAHVLALEVHQQLLDALALQAQIAARRATAADDRQLHRRRVIAAVGLAHIHERPNDDVRAIVGHQPWPASP